SERFERKISQASNRFCDIAIAVEGFAEPVSDFKAAFIPIQPRKSARTGKFVIRAKKKKIIKRFAREKSCLCFGKMLAHVFWSRNLLCPRHPAMQFVKCFADSFDAFLRKGRIGYSEDQAVCIQFRRGFKWLTLH